MLFVENGVELVGHLRQQQSQVDVAAGKHNIVEIEACDVEELLDERVEPVSFVERHARKARTLLNWQIGGLLQQRKIAHHAGERRAKVVRQVGDQVILAMRLVTQSLLDLALAIANLVERTLDFYKIAVDVVPRVGMIDQAVLNTGGNHAVGVQLALLITLVIQGAAAKEQDAHGKCQHKAKHVEHKSGVKEHRLDNTAKRHSPDRQRNCPCGAADHHAAANDFESIDQQKADE